MKIKLYNVRGEEFTLAENWAKKHQVEISMTTDPLTMETVHEAKGFDGVANAQVGSLEDGIYAELEKMGIKQLAQRSAGVDMYNLELASKHGIIITNVPSYSPESIAEFTVTIALNLIRHVRAIEARVEKHNFSWETSIRGRVLGDMTVAIIGTGRIGQCAARFFKGFGCRVLGYDLYPNPNLEGILEYTSSVLEAVQEADVISLHMPPSADNYHLFNKELFAQFKPGAILLNMARGALVKTEDLLEALDQGLLAGAGIDTYEFEGNYVPKNFEGKKIEDSLFKQVLTHPKVIYTPHVAYYTDEALKNIVEGGLNATLEVIETGTAQTRVN